MAVVGISKSLNDTLALMLSKKVERLTGLTLRDFTMFRFTTREGGDPLRMEQEFILDLEYKGKRGRVYNIVPGFKMVEGAVSPLPEIIDRMAYETDKLVRQHPDYVAPIRATANFDDLLTTQKNPTVRWKRWGRLDGTEKNTIEAGDTLSIDDVKRSMAILGKNAAESIDSMARKRLIEGSAQNLAYYKLPAEPAPTPIKWSKEDPDSATAFIQK